MGGGDSGRYYGGGGDSGRYYGERGALTSSDSVEKFGLSDSVV